MKYNYFYGAGELKLIVGTSSKMAKVASVISTFKGWTKGLLKATKNKATLKLGKVINATKQIELSIFGKIYPEFALDVVAQKMKYTGSITTKTINPEFVDLFRKNPIDLSDLPPTKVFRDGVEEILEGKIGKTISTADGEKLGLFEPIIKHGKATLKLVAMVGTVADKLELTIPQTTVEIEEEPDEDCPVCNKAYWPCLVYKKATTKDRKAALNKLCTLNPSNKDVICQELYGYNVGEINGFLEDLVSNLSNADALSNHVTSIDVELLKAWKAITDAANVGTAFSEDYPLLVKIKEIQADNAKKSIFKSNTIADFQQFLRAYNITPCNTCPAPASGSLPSFFPKLDEILENTVEAYQAHNTKTGFTTFFTREPLSNGNNFSKDGGQHMLKYMANNSFTDNAVGFDGAMINGSQYDIYLGSTANIRYVECKSYQEETELNTTKGVNQLIGYLRQPDLTNLNQIRYVFNAKKLSNQQAKEKMQAVFRNNALSIWDAKPTLFNSFQFNGIPVIRQTFQNFLNSINEQHPIYNFVIIN